MRHLAIVALAAAVATPSWAAEPVLVPDFTPGTTSEFALAFMLQDRVIEDLRNHGHVVITGDAAAPVTGGLEACADLPTCAPDALAKLPARWAIVVRVERREGALSGQVVLYERSAGTPVDRAQVPIEGGKEQAFSDAIVRLLDTAVADLGGATGTDLARARAFLAGSHEDPRVPPDRIDGDPLPPPRTPPPPKDPVVPAPLDEPVPTVPKIQKGSLADGTFEARMEKAGLSPRHLIGCRSSFEAADGPPLEWLFQNTPHAGRLIVEVRGGYALGDTQRQADVRVYLDGDEVVGDWFQEYPTAANMPRGALYVGYAPSTYVDFGVEAGLQYGHRTLHTAVIDGGDTGEVFASSAQAVQAWVQPTARLYVVHLGLAKPYVLGGFHLRAFDAFDIAASDLPFPEPPGGVFFGPTVGGGLMIDPGPIVGFFAEGSYTPHFGARALPAQRGERPGDAPDPAITSRNTVAITGGVQFRL